MSKALRRGFTLIELLVVIAIIGLLASIILASLSTAESKGRDARRLSDVKEIQLALELYYDANNGYPVSLAPLKPTYISALPTDPSSNATCTTGAEQGCYDYEPLQGLAPSGFCGSYHLGTSLEVSNTSILDSDTDGNPGGAYGGADGSGVYDGSPCSGAGTIVNNNSGADFTGNAAAKCISTDVGNYCYDVEP